MIFVSYQVAGTMGQRVQSGMRSAQIYSQEGKLEVINIELGINTVNGFSGHSDRRQLLNYVRRLRPQPRRVFVIHGEESKTENIARTLSKLRGVRGYAPRLLDTFSLA